MRRFFAVLLAVCFASLSFVSLVAVAQAQAPAASLVSTTILKSDHTLLAPNGQVSVTIAGATTNEPLSVTLRFSISHALPTRFIVIGTPFTLQVPEVTDTQPQRQTSPAPMKIVMRYDPPAGIIESELVMVYYDLVAQKWLPLPTTIDTANHMASATLSQLADLALIWRSAMTSLPGNAIIVDDRSPGFAKFGPAGNWHDVYTSTTNFWQNYMYWTYRNQSVRENYATWTPALAPDAYTVYAFIPSYNTNPENARYQIVHQGSTTVHPIPQSSYFAEWVALGTYSFGSGAGNYVLLEDLTHEITLTRIGFDAIAFVPNKVYLPLVLNNYPPIKIKSGIHLGNRLLADWDTSTTGSYDFLARLRGNAGGIWPAAIVIQSNQIYNIERSAEGNCPILRATVLRPAAFAFIKQAAQAGTRVIVRITPSPGNFEDALKPGDPGLSHTLITSPDVTPQNQPYCYDPIPNDGKYTAADYFRAIDDVAAEMNAIHSLNMSNGFTEASFEPANEPNGEWGWTETQIKNFLSWSDMDAYFSALYDYVHSNYPGVRVLTPPMSQGLYAETERFESCESMAIFLGKSGYDFMQNTYTTKNDGYSWHNYWRQTREGWVATGDPCPNSNHVFQYFPQWLQTQIASSGKPAFITEADLLSPCQIRDNFVTNKGSQSDAIQESIWRFILEEHGANYVVAWLLTESPHFTIPVCSANTTLTDYAEIKWHEAYKEEGLERAWFVPWWTRPEQ